MAKRVKISDLPVVEDKEAPVLCHLSYPSQDDPALLHISDRTGIIPTTHKYGVTSIYHITRCNRPLEHPHFYQESEFPELDYLPEYRLCPRCGSRDEFKEALVKRNEWVVQRERQLEKEREEKREAAELERVRRQMAITNFLMDKAEELETLLRLKGLMLKMPPGRWEVVDADDQIMGEFLVLAHNYLWDMLNLDAQVEQVLAKAMDVGGEETEA